MLDTLLTIAALHLVPAQHTADRAGEVQGYTLPSTALSFAQREGKFIAPAMGEAVETRPTVKVGKPNIWEVN